MNQRLVCTMPNDHCCGLAWRSWSCDQRTLSNLLEHHSALILLLRAQSPTVKPALCLCSYTRVCLTEICVCAHSHVCFYVCCWHVCVPCTHMCLYLCQQCAVLQSAQVQDTELCLMQILSRLNRIHLVYVTSQSSPSSSLQLQHTDTMNNVCDSQLNTGWSWLNDITAHPEIVFSPEERATGIEACVPQKNICGISIAYMTCCVSAVGVKIYGLIAEWSLYSEIHVYTD